MNPELVKRYLHDRSVLKDAQYISINPSSGVYTRVGILLETFKLVELPEILSVLRGHLSFVGNRALPSSLQHQLEPLWQANESSFSRLSTPAGIFGIVQMYGRDNLANSDRYRLEKLYCQLQYSNYSLRLDLCIIVLNILYLFKLYQVSSVEQAEHILNSLSNPRKFV